MERLEEQIFALSGGGSGGGVGGSGPGPSGGWGGGGGGRLPQGPCSRGCSLPRGPPFALCGGVARPAHTPGPL